MSIQKLGHWKYKRRGWRKYVWRALEMVVRVMERVRRG